MRKRVFLFWSMCVLLTFTGCTREVKQEAEAPEETGQEIVENPADKEPLSGKLVISLPYYFGSIVNQIENFRAAYPEVELEVRSATEPGEPLSDMGKMDEYIQQMAVDLMSGSDVDIYETSWLSYYKYAKSGVLEDLYSFMEADPDFHTDDYYMNIFQALEYDGKLCLMPSHVTYDLVRINTDVAGELPEEKRTISYREIQELYEQALLNGKISGQTDFALNDSATEAIFARNEYVRYVDVYGGKAGFDTPDFQSYLAFARTYLDWGSAEGRLYMDLPTNQKDWFMNCFRMDLFTLQETAEGVSQPMLLASSAGNNAFATIGEILSISSFSENKELAWEFMKFLIEEKDYPFEEYEMPEYNKIDYYISYVPVNRKNFVKCAETVFGNRFGRDVSEDVAYWDEVNQDLNTPTFADIRISGIMKELRKEFQQGRLDEEEYADLLQERVQMYFME